MAGTRGPVPKRSTERRRRNKESKVQTIKPRSTRKPPAPRPKATWDPLMKKWFTALGKSAQSELYQPSEWAEAEIWCEVMTRALKSPRPVSAHLLAAFSAFSTRILVTEGDRRRVRLEIELGGAEQPAGVTSLAAYRDRAGA